jgi:uncharacterized iron-regulated protein
MVGWWLLVACPKPAPVAAPVAAVASGPAPTGGPWRSTVSADHPLVGRIWSVRDGRFASEDELLADLRAVPYVMLGEKHDNPDHHRLQAELVGELQPKACAFEMLDHADPIADAADPDALATAADWANSGWPDFAIYRPVFAACYDAHAAVVAASPTRDEVRTAMTSGIDALPAEVVAGLDRSHPLDDAQRASLTEEIEDSHCGQATPEMVTAMIQGQVFKDAFFARALAAEPVPAVLIAGGGHTRTDRGVPLYLEPESRTVLLAEVDPDRPDPAQYTGESPDWIWFTPAVSDEDPCVAFAEQLKKMGHGPPPPGPR